MSTREQRTSMLSVYDGRTCRGFVMDRSRQGFEAIDHNNQSLGFFDHQQEAILALLNERERQ